MASPQSPQDQQKPAPKKFTPAMPSRAAMNRNASAPANPSPLRQESPDLSKLSLSESDDKKPATPVEGHSAVSENAMVTPPQSKPAAATIPTTQHSTGAMGKFAYTPVDDPFVTPKANGSQSAIVLTQLKSAQRGNFSPREDRVGKEINPENAQGSLSPQACIFVANLSNQRSDPELEKSVSDVFAQFGKCYVKIRRDRNRMPFAFVQFENVDSAFEAVKQARGAVIDNRPTRCEHAKVNRALYLSRQTGGPVSEEEAREVLEPFGPLESINVISLLDQQMFNLPEGIMVQFAYFQDSRDCVAALKGHDIYRITPPQQAADSRYGLPSPSPHRPYFTRQPSARYRSNDETSIFVGNLPHGTSKQKMVTEFAPFGQIQTVDVITKPAPNGDGTNTFAFLTFEHSESADAAIQTEMSFDGFKLRIERKQYSNRHTYHTAHNGVASEEEILSRLYHNALHMGLSHEKGVRILNINQRASIENGPQGYATTSSINPNLYYPPMMNHGMSPIRGGPAPAFSPPNNMQAYQYPPPMNYNAPAGPFYQHHGPAEMEDRSTMHTIAEVHEPMVHQRRFNP